MRSLIPNLFLAALCFVVPAKAGIATVTPPTGRSLACVGDMDDTGVLPLTMHTPLGEATVLVGHGWAILSINGVALASGPLWAIPLLPGMEAATVSGGYCKVTTSTDEDGGYVSIFTPIYGTSSTLGGAVADYKAQMAAAGLAAVPCEPTQG